MKRLFYLVLFILPVFIMPNASAADEIDQQCSPEAFISSQKIVAGSWQTFVAQKNRLSKIKVNVFRHNLEGDPAVVNLKVYTNPISSRSSQLIDGGSKSLNEAGEAALVFDFIDKEVVTGDSYKILLTTNSDVSWLKKDGGTCYRYGHAFANSKILDPIADYGFVTYGYNFIDNPPVSATDNDEDEINNEVIAEKNTDLSSEDKNSELSGLTDSTGTEQDVKQFTETSNITSDIEPPTALLALDTPNDNGGSITLSWEKSTTDGVDGYMVFRQFEETGDIYLIGETDKNNTKFIDKKAKTGQTYYYFIRAKKGDFQSVNSDKAEALSVDNTLKNSINQNTTVKNKNINNYLWFFVSGGVLLVAGVIFLIVKWRKRVKEKLTSKV